MSAKKDELDLVKAYKDPEVSFKNFDHTDTPNPYAMARSSSFALFRQVAKDIDESMGGIHEAGIKQATSVRDLLKVTPDGKGENSGRAINNSVNVRDFTKLRKHHSSIKNFLRENTENFEEDEEERLNEERELAKSQKMALSQAESVKADAPAAETPETNNASPLEHEARKYSSKLFKSSTPSDYNEEPSELLLDIYKRLLK